MTEAEQNVLDYLKLLRTVQQQAAAEIPKSWKYQGPADLLLREGKFFKIPTGANAFVGEPNACFRNAALYAVGHRLRYIEGFTLGVIPVHHAWCADSAGEVIEVTWPELGTAYYGIEFEPRRVLRGAVLFNPCNRSVYSRKIKPA